MLALETKGDKFVAILDRNHEFFSRAYMAVRGLLTVSELSGDKWAMGYDDFLTLKTKLDSLGLVEGRTCNKDVADLLAHYQALEKRNNDIKAGVHNEYVNSLLKGKLKSTPYKDQVTGISYLMNNRRVGCWDSMGLGKTLETLGTIVALNQEVKKSLVVCPKSVMMGFAKDIKKHTYLNYVSIPAGRKNAISFLRDQKHGDWDIMLVHPENLIGATKRETYGDVTKLLKTMSFDMIAIDEWHMYKNLGKKRTDCVLSLLSEVRNHQRKQPRAILMTGTPVSESPLNAYVTLKVLSNDVLPHIDRFENHFTIKDSFNVKVNDKRRPGKKKTVAVKKIKGYKNLGELKARMERASIRRTKDDMEGFPDQVFQTRYVELGGNQKALYKTACGEVVQSLSGSSKINLEQFFSSASAVRLRQLLNHPKFLDEKGNSAKYDEIDNILEELFADPEQKIILWTEYRQAVDLIYDRWNEQYGVMKLYGGVEIDEALAASFEADKGPRIAACIPQKAGTGVDFLARARTAIYIDRPYSYTLYKQSIDRIHRRVKTEGELSKLDRIKSQPATVIYLDVPGSIDELVAEKLYGKQQIADALTIENSKLISMGKRDLLKYLK